MYREMALEELVRDRAAGGQLVAAVREVRSAEYQSRFASWHERASVRVKPRRELAWTAGADALYFPPELVPVATHPLVVQRGPAAVRRVLIQRLYHYLHFTTELEELAVIPIAAKISRGRAGLRLPETMREDAFKIVTDEAWHAQFSYELLRQVEARTSVPCRTPEVPQFIERLDQIRQSMDPDLRGAEGLMFSIVSETLISAILADLPNDARLPAAVRDVVRDHAEDEGRHHAYFRSLLEYVWPALSQRERHRIGPWLPQVILAFLEPDYRALGFALADLGLSAAETEQALVESYPRPLVVGWCADAARAAVRYFTEAGALGHAGTHDAFAAAGLLSDRPV